MTESIPCVCVTISEGIKVEATGGYVGQLEDQHSFTYRFRITNTTPRPVQLIGRHLLFQDSWGSVQEVPKGSGGVVGHTPVLKEGQLYHTIVEYRAVGRGAAIGEDRGEVWWRGAVLGEGQGAVLGREAAMVEDRGEGEDQGEVTGGGIAMSEDGGEVTSRGATMARPETFEYHSGCYFHTKGGTMMGSFQMIDVETKEPFETSFGPITFLPWVLAFVDDE
eukprot:gene2056-2752_t